MDVTAPAPVTCATVIPLSRFREQRPVAIARPAADRFDPVRRILQSERRSLLARLAELDALLQPGALPSA